MSKKLVAADQQKDEGMKILEDVIPLEIQVEHQIELSNSWRVDLDEENLGKNIDKVAMEGDLSPKQVAKIKAYKGLQWRKGTKVKASSMQTRSLV